MTQSCTNIVISRWQIQVADTGSLCDGVIPVLDTGMALLHSTLSSDGLRQIYVMISNLAIPISVNLLSK
ncbi:hypothetical protein ACJZL1_00915 [Wolbachia endosymbiont of Rhagoletis indifferens]|uniref:hypothetical protein n=1 Tax=Wolbachia endosymbiont of Rhagoletis indifferens TaxID=3383250 RepID=UPI003AF3B743